MTRMIETLINGQWSLLLPEHRAARPEWSTPAGWERARWDSLAANIRPGDHVLDIGTEEGDLSALLAGWVGPGGKVALFEPNPAVWPNIRAIFDANGLTDRAEWWVGFAGPYTTRPGTTWEPVTMPDGWPDCAHGPIIGDHGFCILSERPDLPAITLDDFCERHDMHPAVITMDVEGAELEVLHGAGRVLREDRPLVYISIHHEFMRDTWGRDSRELWTYLGDEGYESTHLATDHERHEVFWAPDGRTFIPPPAAPTA